MRNKIIARIYRLAKIKTQQWLRRTQVEKQQIRSACSDTNFNKINLLLPNSLNVMKMEIQRLELITYKRLLAMDVIPREYGEDKGNTLDIYHLAYNYLQFF